MKKAVFFIALAVLSTQALADKKHQSPEKMHQCKKSDLNGNYVMFQAAVNKPEMNHNGRCEVNISNGVLSGVCNFGRNAAGNPGFNGVVYGDATINKNCSVEVNISFDPVPNVVHIDSVFELQFSPDKQSFVGRFSNNFGVEGISNGTRYSASLPSTVAE
jgi:hypothetical protein